MMSNFKRIIFILLLSAFSLGGFSRGNMFTDSNLYVENKEETMTILVTINGSSYASMKDIPKTGHLEVYSILGQRVNRLNLKNCEGGAYLDLPAGLYILKAGKVAQKVIVK